MAILLTRKTPKKENTEEKNEETLKQIQSDIAELQSVNKNISDSLLFTIMRG